MEVQIRLGLLSLVGMSGSFLLAEVLLADHGETPVCVQGAACPLHF